MKYTVLIFAAAAACIGCGSHEDLPAVFDLKLYPGAAVVGNGSVCVVYSDDERTFNDTAAIRGGIQRYYYNDFEASYIGGSAVELLTDEGAVAFDQDTFGLSPFFSPFMDSRGDGVTMRSRLFVTKPGITVQQIRVIAERDLPAFARWSLFVPSDAGTDGVRISGRDILEDALFLRYDNGIILAAGTYGENSQFAYDEENEIASVTVPLRLTAGIDTTLTFFIAAGTSDMDVITTMFTVDDTDLFHESTRYWTAWLDQTGTIGFPHEQFASSYQANRYAVFASALNGLLPELLYEVRPAADTAAAGAIGDLTESPERVRRRILEGDIRGSETLLRGMIEHANSYGLVVKSGSAADGRSSGIYFSPAFSAEYIDAMMLFLEEISV